MNVQHQAPLPSTLYTVVGALLLALLVLIALGIALSLRPIQRPVAPQVSSITQASGFHLTLNEAPALAPMTLPAVASEKATVTEEPVLPDASSQAPLSHATPVLSVAESMRQRNDTSAKIAPPRKVERITAKEKSPKTTVKSPAKTENDKKPVHKPESKATSKPSSKTLNKAVTPDKSATKAPTTASNKPSASTASTKAKIRYWQVGSFESKSSLRERERTLHRAGIQNTVVQSYQLKGKTFYRLRVGPFQNNTEAESMRKRLQTHKLSPLPITQP